MPITLYNVTAQRSSKDPWKFIGCYSSWDTAQKVADFVRKAFYPKMPPDFQVKWEEKTSEEASSDPHQLDVDEYERLLRLDLGVVDEESREEQLLVKDKMKVYFRVTLDPQGLLLIGYYQAAKLAGEALTFFAQTHSFPKWLTTCQVHSEVSMLFSGTWVTKEGQKILGVIDRREYLRLLSFKI